MERIACSETQVFALNFVMHSIFSTRDSHLYAQVTASLFSNVSRIIFAPTLFSRSHRRGNTNERLFVFGCTDKYWCVCLPTILDGEVEKWENKRNGRRLEQTPSKKSNIAGHYSKDRRYWPSSSTKGISPRSAAARPVRLIIFHKIFHENDSITCGDVRPDAIMLSHFVRRARTSCSRLISWQTRGRFINLPQSKINFASETLNRFIFTYYIAYSLKCLTERENTNKFYEKE